MDIKNLLGDDADDLLGYTAKGIDKADLYLPGPDIIERVFVDSDRSPQVLRSFQSLVEPRPARRHRATCRSFRSTRASSTPRRPRSRPNPMLHGPARTSSSWRSRAAATRWPRPSASSGRCRRRYAHKIPFIVKINHNELLTFPNKFDQVMFGSVEQAYDLGAAASAQRSTSAPTRRPARSRRSRQAFAGGPRPRDGHRSVVLPAQQRVQGGRRRLPRLRRPHGPGQPPRRHHRGRHHQAEAADATTAATTRSRASARPRRWCTTSSRATTRSTWPAGRSPTATWAASGSSTGRRVEGRERPGRGGAHRGDQQAGRRRWA